MGQGQNIVCGVTVIHPPTKIESLCHRRVFDLLGPLVLPSWLIAILQKTQTECKVRATLCQICTWECLDWLLRKYWPQQPCEKISPCKRSQHQFLPLFSFCQHSKGELWLDHFCIIFPVSHLFFIIFPWFCIIFQGFCKVVPSFSQLPKWHWTLLSPNPLAPSRGSVPVPFRRWAAGGWPPSDANMGGESVEMAGFGLRLWPYWNILYDIICLYGFTRWLWVYDHIHINLPFQWNITI